MLRIWRAGFLVWLGLFGSACGSSDATAPSAGAAPEVVDPNAGAALARAVDTNPDPHVFETEITAKVAELELVPGTKTSLYTYNGVLPGPLIQLSRGDKLIVHFKNELPEATTIHWHGIRLPNAMDGVPDETQPAVEPGASFVYEFVVPDSGTYWYHPHLRSAAQVGFGLYGALVVDEPDEPAELGEGFPVILSDIAIEADGRLSPADQSGDLATLFGREGNILLTNGKQAPFFHVQRGQRQRFQFINAAKSRYFQLGAEGHRFLRIGGDGGFTAAPLWEERVVLAPGERADVLFTVDPAAPAELPMRWIPFDRGFGSTEFRPEVVVMRLAVSEEPALTPPPPPVMSRDIQPLDISSATQISMAFTDTDRPEFSLGFDGVPGWELEPIEARIGETHVWTVTNDMDFSHPFHLHGFFFQVLEVNGVPPPVLELKDTANVPLKGGSLKLAVHFDERPGMWMIHCHILDHADAGMMRMLHLHPAAHHE